MKLPLRCIPAANRLELSSVRRVVHQPRADAVVRRAEVVGVPGGHGEQPQRARRQPVGLQEQDVARDVARPARLRRAVLPGSGFCASGIAASTARAARSTTTLPHASNSAGSTARQRSRQSSRLPRWSRAALRLPLQPRLRARRRRRAPPAAGGAGLQRRAHARARPQAARRTTPRWSCSPSWGSRRTRSTTCSTSTRCSTPCSTRSQRVVEASRELSPVLIVGAPLRVEGGLFNCAVVDPPRRACSASCPKSYLPNYREYYEERQFRAAREAIARRDRAARADGAVRHRPGLRGVRPARASRSTSRSARTSGRRSRRRTYGALAGATVLANLSREQHHDRQGRLPAHARAWRSRRAAIAAYIYTAAGQGESTTDLAWDGQALICENGDLLAEAERFASSEQLLCADVDLDRIVSDRVRHEQLRRLDPATTASALAGVPARCRSSSASPRAAQPLRRDDRALPVRPGRPRDARRALLRGLQHPGPRPRDSACARPGSRRS